MPANQKNSPALLPLAEARALIAAHISPLPPLVAPLAEAAGRILRADVCAALPVTPGGGHIQRDKTPCLV